MAITRNEAAAALSDIESTQRRGMTLRGYRVGGPILMMWSLIWATGYLTMGLAPPELWLPVWLGLDVVGVAAALLLARAGKPEAAGAPPGMTWRLLGGSLSMMVFALSVFWVMKPTDPAAAMAFPGLLIGVIYAVVGFWAAPRYALIGGLMFGLTLVGYFLFQPWLPFWMAAASGALFLSGVWLWRR